MPGIKKLGLDIIGKCVFHADFGLKIPRSNATPHEQSCGPDIQPCVPEELPLVLSS
jgi:hypothetical protein